MADKAIGELDRAPQISDDSLIPIEEQGKAMAMTGKQFADFAREAAAADVQRAVDAADDAETSAESAKTDADRAEAAMASIVLDEQKMAQAVENAENSAAAAETSAENAAESEAGAVEAMNRAQAYAEQASVPAVEGVYNVVLTDRETGERYALIVENGVLKMLGVSESLDSTSLTLIDNATGVAYEVIAEGGILKLMEV